MGESSGDLLDMVSHEHGRRGGGIGGELGEAADQVLTPAEIEPSGRLIEQEQSRFGEQRASQLDPLSLP